MSEPELQGEALDGIWIAEGEAWFANAPALCDRIKADYIAHVDGQLYVGIAGKGEISLHEALKGDRSKKSDDSKVVQLKP